MGDREALLQAVCEYPDDDLPRLVFADWLDEHGEPERAEFIRVQCETDSLRRDPRRLKKLLLREEMLRRAHEERWRFELPTYSWMDETSKWGAFKRGFIEGIRVGQISVASVDWETLSESTPLIQLTLFGARDVRFAFCHRYARRFQRVILWRCQLNDIDVRFLSQPSVFTMMRRIDVINCELNGDQSRRLQDRYGSILSLST